ncbi:hypothetical protein ACFJGX_01490 [Hydrogenophaga sp. UC242_50]
MEVRQTLPVPGRAEADKAPDHTAGGVHAVELTGEPSVREPTR